MRVGTSCRRFAYRPYCRDHPHACGDKLIVCYHKQTLPGSSPCVWGQVNNHL